MTEAGNRSSLPSRGGPKSRFCHELAQNFHWILWSVLWLVPEEPRVLLCVIFTVFSRNRPDLWKVLKRGEVGCLAFWIMTELGLETGALEGEMGLCTDLS